MRECRLRECRLGSTRRGNKRRKEEDRNEVHETLLLSTELQSTEVVLCYPIPNDRKKKRENEGEVLVKGLSRWTLSWRGRDGETSCGQEFFNLRSVFLTFSSLVDAMGCWCHRVNVCVILLSLPLPLLIFCNLNLFCYTSSTDFSCHHPLRRGNHPLKLPNRWEGLDGPVFPSLFVRRCCALSFAWKVTHAQTSASLPFLGLLLRSKLSSLTLVFHLFVWVYHRRQEEVHSLQ